MRFFNRKNSGLATARKSVNRLSHAIMEVVESRVMLSTSLTGYSSVVTDIQPIVGATSANGYVNGGTNASSGPLATPTFAVVEFDASNSTIFPGASTAPTLSGCTTGGNLAASTKYYVEYTWSTASGETTAGAETSFTSGNTTTNKETLAFPAAPTGATALNVYVGTASNQEAYNGTITSPSTSGTNTYALVNPGAVPNNSGLANPTTAATACTATTGGTLAGNTTYYVKYTYLNAAGQETTAGNETSFTTPVGTNTNTALIGMATMPSGVTGINVYVGTTPGGETFNGSVLSPSSVATGNTTNTYLITSPTGTAATPPTTNATGLVTTPVAPSVVAAPIGGNLTGNTTYYVKYTWTASATSGQTTASAETSITTPVGGNTNSLIVTAPSTWPVGVNGYKVYVGTTSGGEVLYGSGNTSTSGNNLTVSTPPTGSTNPPTTSTVYTIAAAGAAGSTVYPAQTGGTLPSGTKYYYVYTWTNASGQTLSSSEGSVTTAGAFNLPATSTNSIVLNLPAAPTGATGANIYVGNASLQEVYNGSLTSVSTTAKNPYLLTTVATSATVPIANNSGIANPTTAATIVPSTTGGTLPGNTTYYVNYTFITSTGESLAGTETSFTTALGTSTNSAAVTLPALPTGATSIKIYVGTASGREVYNGTTTTTTYTVKVAPSITPLPTANTASIVNPTSPTSLQLTLVNNPSAYNSTTGATGTVASGTFDVYLLPTYTVPVGSNLTYLTTTAAGLPLGLEGQGGLSSVIASNFYLGNFTPTASGPMTINLNLPSTGVSNAALTLTNALNTNASFELAIVPETSTSAAQFAAESDYANNTTDTSTIESPKLGVTVTSAAENFAMAYGNVTVNQDNVMNQVEIDVLRNGYAGDAATVAYGTSNGNGTAGTDYTATSGTLSFAAGQTVGVITVPTIDTNGTPDKTFKVTLGAITGGTNATIGSTGNATVTIVGTTNEADTIGGTVQDSNGCNSFTIGTSGATVQVVKPAANTFIPVSGSVTNGTGSFSTQSFAVLQFNAQAAQESENVTSVSSLSLELDNDNSAYGAYSDGTAFSGPNPQTLGNFNIYLLNSSYTSSPTSSLAFEGADANSGGLNGQETAVLLGTASFSNQTTTATTKSPLGNPEGLQDVYTIELSSAAQTALIKDLNSGGYESINGNTSYVPFAPIRLAITPGSSAFAALFANNNSGTGGNYGIQPYLWFNGVTTTVTEPAENFAIQYSTVNVNANETGVAVDISRSATSFNGDAATVNFSLTNGSAILGTDYSAPTSYSVSFTAGQTVATVVIPITTNPSLATEKTFTIQLTGATTAGTEPAATFASTPTTITITPPLAATHTAITDGTGAAELNASALYGGYAYLNGSTSNGTGSFAYQGFEVLEFPASQFVQPGQTMTSLTNLSLGMSNYENNLNSGANYDGPAGDFTLYVAGTNESTTEAVPGNFGVATPIGDPGDYNGNTVDGVGGFSNGSGLVGPLSAPTGSPATPLNQSAISDYGIPIGVISFNQKLGMDYFTPSQAALTQQWTLPGMGNVTESALQLIESQVNAGQNIRILAAPGDSAFRAYFYGSNTGPNTPQLQVVDAVSTTETAESVSFASAVYNVDNNVGQISGGNVTVTLTRSLLENSGTGLADALTVSYATSDGNALNGVNYTAVSGNVTFAAGNATAIINVPITYVNNLSGDKAFTITLSSPTTNGGNTTYVTPVLGNIPTATVFIVDNANNAQTLTQYTSSVGDMGTNGPVTFGTSALNPAPPFNYSMYTGGKETVMDFNDSTVVNYNDPAEFNSATGPINPDSGNSTDPYNLNGVAYAVTAGNNTANNTYTNSLGIGNVTYTTKGNGSLYTSNIAVLNEITLSYVNYYASSPGMLLNVYLVTDATDNILPGAAGTSKNPHFYDTSIDNITSRLGNGLGNATDSSTQFGPIYLLGTITNPTTVNYSGYVNAPLTSFLGNATSGAEGMLISDLNNGTKFRIVVTPQTANTSLNADWIYGYSNANPSYATNTATPINFYIQPELSFDVSYASNNTAGLPAYITPSANADYVWDPSTGNLTVTNGTLTFGNSSSDTTDLPVNLTAGGATTQVVFTANQGLAGLTLSGGATADVQGNIVTMSNTTLDTASTLQSYVIGGQIFSSTLVSSSYAIGYSGHVTGTGGATFSEFRYTIKGDTNLDGQVNSTDLYKVIQDFGGNDTLWSDGNVQYNGNAAADIIGSADLYDVIQNFGGIIPSTPVFAGGILPAGTTVGLVQTNASVVDAMAVQTTVPVASSPLVATATVNSDQVSALAAAVDAAPAVSQASAPVAAAAVTPAASLVTVADSAISADELYLGVSYQPVFA